MTNDAPAFAKAMADKMTNMTNYTQIGFTKKTHGVSGELKVAIEEAYEDVFFDADRVFLEIRGSKQPFFIENIRGGGELIVQFEDVPTREDALLLQGRGIFLPEDEIPEIHEPVDDLEYGRIQGYLVSDQIAGEVGVVQEVVEMPQQEMAVVNYRGKEVMIPLNPQFVQSIDDDAKRVSVQLPEGLLTL